jgi:signal transduction histidine kinase
MAEQLEKKERNRRQLLADIAHELRTPLNSVIGFAQVLLRQHFGPLTDKQKEYVRDIYESGDHLLSLINDILDLSKIEVGKLTLEIKKIALGPKIERALVFVREKAMAHGISLETKISEDLPDVFADERAILQILVNLLSNAVKFTPDGGRVEIKSYPQGDFIAVDVLDTGMGIAIEDQKKIFRLFEQLSVSSPYKREGTGLGLSIAQSLVTAMGGIITVKSELSKGSCFTFTLPITKENEEERSDENRKT